MKYFRKRNLGLSIIDSRRSNHRFCRWMTGDRRLFRALVPQASHPRTPQVVIYRNQWENIAIMAKFCCTEHIKVWELCLRQQRSVKFHLHSIGHTHVNNKLDPGLFARLELFCSMSTFYVGSEIRCCFIWCTLLMVRKSYIRIKKVIPKTNNIGW